ncbi:MAG: epoxyqueuosine reductase QueH [Chitinispirillaceae bacterium]|nr:epoxyqueuosine reductase QueH [Chitinispirillaceae bacterium]
MRTFLLLHICCAPDEAWVVKSLKDEYNLHCFFYNPNIYPLSEYTLRLEEARKVAEYYNVPFTAGEYDNELWEEAIKPFSHLPEGSERCRHCFIYRFNRTAEFCKKSGFSVFTSVMSISPHKKISVLNESGKMCASKYNVEYACFDFKKKDGFKKSIELSKELGLYRQDYCGCRYSLTERDLRKQNKNGLHNNQSK